MKEKCRVHIINEFDEKETLEFYPLEYNSLMELVINETYEEWGDCMGRAWCGTCHVTIIDGGEPASEFSHTEQNKLEELPNKTENSRLACQITADQSIHNMTFKILKDM